RHSDVIEHRAFNRRQADRQESEHQAAGQREAQLDVPHGDPRSNQLIELWASGPSSLWTERALVSAERSGRVAANQLGAAEEDGEAIAVAAEAAEHQPADRDRERLEEYVPAVVDHRRGKRPGADGRRNRETRARARERSDVAEQRV